MYNSSSSSSSSLTQVLLRGEPPLRPLSKREFSAGRDLNIANSSLAQPLFHTCLMCSETYLRSSKTYLGRTTLVHLVPLLLVCLLTCLRLFFRLLPVLLELHSVGTGCLWDDSVAAGRCTYEACNTSRYPTLAYSNIKVTDGQSHTGFIPEVCTPVGATRKPAVYHAKSG